MSRYDQDIILGIEKHSYAKLLKFVDTEVAKRQRLNQTSIRKCGIAENLLKDWASGGISAVRLAEHMHTLRYTDNFTPPAVIRLSDIGGKTPCLVNSKNVSLGCLTY